MESIGPQLPPRSPYGTSTALQARNSPHKRSIGSGILWKGPGSYGRARDPMEGPGILWKGPSPPPVGPRTPHPPLTRPIHLYRPREACRPQPPLSDRSAPLSRLRSGLHRRLLVLLRGSRRLRTFPRKFYSNAERERGGGAATPSWGGPPRRHLGGDAGSTGGAGRKSAPRRKWRYPRGTLERLTSGGA